MKRWDEDWVLNEYRTLWEVVGFAGLVMWKEKATSG